MNITDIQNFFTAADRNHNGVLTAKELKKAISSQSTEIQAKLKFFLKDNGKIDNAKFNILANGDSKVTSQELINLLTSKDDDNNVQILGDDELDLKFDNIASISSVDANGNGKLSSSEIVKAYKNAPDGSGLKQLLSKFVTITEKGKVKANKDSIKAQSGGNEYLSYSNLENLIAEITGAGNTNNSDNNNDDENDTNETNENTSGANLNPDDEVDVFSFMDKNGNGKVTTKEMLKVYNSAPEGSELKAMLSNFITTNNKGKLQVNLAKVRLLSGGKKYLTRANLTALDTNANGIASSAEVKLALGKHEEFSVLDINGNGKIKLSEIKKYAKALPDSGLATYIASLATKKEMKRVFKVLSGGKNYVTAEDIARYDKDGNGIICAEELNAFKNEVMGIAGTGI